MSTRNMRVITEMTKIILREITTCTKEQKKAVLKVRNQESVRTLMYTDHKISLNEHLAWLDRVKYDERRIVFVILINEKVGGVVTVDAIDRLHLKSEWAFYLDSKLRGGLGAVIIWYPKFCIS